MIPATDADEITRRDELRITIVEPLGTGGMVHYAYQLSTALAEAGASVTLLTSDDYELSELPHAFAVDRRLRLWPHHDAARATRADGSRTGRSADAAWRALRRVWRAAKVVRAWVVLVRLLDSRTTDVVQFGTLRFPFEFVFLHALKRRGFVLADICHEPELRERGQKWIGALASAASGAAYRSLDAVFLHGAYNRELFGRLYPALRARAFSIEHGNQRIFRLLAGGAAGSPEAATRSHYGLGDEPVVLFFGHLVPSKGVEDLVRAHALSVRATGARLVVAGYPSKLFDVRGLEQLVRQLGVESSVVLDLRYIPGSEVAGLMELSTVVVLPYRSASQSGALQVAYTFGRPVVATRVGGLPEVVDDGLSGYLVPPGSPTELARAIEDIVSSPERVLQMGKYARELAETRFSWSAVAHDVLAVYDQLVRR